MARSYLPAVYAGRTWVNAAITHALGGMIGGGLLGILIWAASFPVRDFLVAMHMPLLVLMLAAAVVRDFWWQFPIPQRAVQVNRLALETNPVAGAFVYGVSLGAGVLTFVPFASFFVFLLALTLPSSLLETVLMSGAYGLGRASFPFLIASLTPLPAQTGTVVRGMVRMRPVAAAASLLAAGLLAVFA